MGNRDKILHEFLLSTQCFRIHHHQLASVGLAKVDQQWVAETGEPVLMCQHHPLHLSIQHGIDQTQKLFPLKVQPTADLHHPLVYLDLSLLAELFKNPSLVG